MILRLHTKKLSQPMNRMLSLRGLLPILALAASLQLTLGYYDPAAQRWINRDPIGENGGINLACPAENNPQNRADTHGLTLYKCTRGSTTCSGSLCGSGSNTDAPAQHVYLWDDTSQTSCGMGGNICTQGNVSTDGDTGPGTLGHTCVAIPNSSGKEAAVMKCCQNKTTHGWCPWINDCHTFVGGCLTDNGLSDPTIYGRIYGPVDFYHDYCARHPTSWLCRRPEWPFPILLPPIFGAW